MSKTDGDGTHRTKTVQVFLTSLCNDTSKRLLLTRFHNHQGTNIVLCHLTKTKHTHQNTHRFMNFWKGRERYWSTYGFNSVVDSVISGTPKPRSISAFAFGVHNIRNGCALEPMLLHTSRLSGLIASRQHGRLNRRVDHTEMLQQRWSHNVSTGDKRTNHSLHLDLTSDSNQSAYRSKREATVIKLNS